MLAGQLHFALVHDGHILGTGLQVIAVFHDDKRCGHTAHDAEEAPGIPALGFHPAGGILRIEEIRLAPAGHGMGLDPVLTGPAAELGQHIEKAQQFLFFHRALPVIDRRHGGRFHVHRGDHGQAAQQQAAKQPAGQPALASCFSHQATSLA